MSRPMEAGLKDWSSGKKPSTKRFQPKRASFTCAEFTTFTHDSDTSCTRGGRDGVEAGQQAARQLREREALIAVAVVIAAGDVVIGVGIVVDLHDQAVDVVEEAG